MKIPLEVSAALKAKERAHYKLLHATPQNESEKEVLKNTFEEAKAAYQNIVRKYNNKKEIERDQDFLNLLSKNPSQVFKRIKSDRKSLNKRIKALKVGNKLYSDDSISSLQTLPPITSPCFETFAEDHRHILNICKAGKKIPRITVSKAEELLKQIRPGVTDYFLVSAAHYLNGGQAALHHFKFLFNSVLDKIELASIEEMNRAHAIILHKGHGKDSGLDSITISSCPFIAKAIDIYLGKLSISDWKLKQASTQFQGEGMSHEMAALLLTITIQNSLSVRKPIFVLLLDARSAFDLVLRQILIRRLYLD